MLQALEQLNCRWHEPTFQDRAKTIVAVGKSSFDGTALISTPPYTAVAQPDSIAIDHFYSTLKPDSNIFPQLANWDCPGGLVEHSDFASAIAYNLADVVNKTTGSRLNPFAHGVALKLHDLGRTATHSFMETDIMTDHLWGMIGLRQDLHDLTHSAHLYWDNAEIPPHALSVAQKISIIADTAGKRSSIDRNRLRLVEEIIPSVNEGKKKYIGKSDPTFYERMMVEKLPQYSRRENEAIIYTLSWFASLGINLNSIIQAIPLERLS